MQAGAAIVWGCLFASTLAFGITEKWNPFLSKSVKSIGNMILSPNLDFDGSYSLHLGAIDLHQEPGTPVYSVRRGIPSLPKGRKGDSELGGWTTTVQVLSDDGILTYFMHLDPDSISLSLREHIERKEPIEAGTKLGVLYKHQTLDSHVHFGAADCQRHLRLNPQSFLDYKDTERPRILSILLSEGGDNQLVDLPGTVSGEVELTLLAFDTVDGMKKKYPVNRVDLEIFSWEREVYSATVFDATAMPANEPLDNRCEFLTDYDGYSPALGDTLYRHPRERLPAFPIALTAKKESVPDHLKTWFNPFPGPWKTYLYPNGFYTVIATVFDAKGNSTSFLRVLKIQN